MLGSFMDYYLSSGSSLLKPFIGRQRAGVEIPISAISINPMPELIAIAKCIPKAEANRPISIDPICPTPAASPCIPKTLL